MTTTTTTKFKYLADARGFETAADLNTFVTVYYDAGPGVNAQNYFKVRGVPPVGSQSGLVLNIGSDMITLMLDNTLASDGGTYSVMSFGRSEVIDIV